MTRRRPAERVWWVAVTLAVIGIVALIAWFSRPKPALVQGEVEATQIDVASKIAGRVDSVFVREGDAVHRGQILVSIDSPEIRAKLVQASSAERAADAQRAKTERGSRAEEIRAARSLWQQAQTAFELAQKTAERITRLHRDGVVPLQKLDEATAARDASRDAAEAARARYDMAVTGARSEDRAAAGALADQAAGAVSEVNAYLAEARLASPIDGQIAERVLDPGEIVAPGYPIVSVVDLSDIWVTFAMREDRLAGLKIGDRLRGTVPALGIREPVEFEVTYLAPMGDFATWRATNDVGDFDRKTFEVRARPTASIAGLRPGMSILIPWRRGSR